MHISMYEQYLIFFTPALLQYLRKKTNKQKHFQIDNNSGIRIPYKFNKGYRCWQETVFIETLSLKVSRSHMHVYICTRNPQRLILQIVSHFSFSIAYTAPNVPIFPFVSSGVYTSHRIDAELRSPIVRRTFISKYQCPNNRTRSPLRDSAPFKASQTSELQLRSNQYRRPIEIHCFRVILVCKFYTWKTIFFFFETYNIVLSNGG